MNRKIYRKVAEAALQNAKELSRDAEHLRRVGHRGHACSLAVLSIEEAAKSFLYSLAAHGFSRVVHKRTNQALSFYEKDVLDHKTKHRVFAGLLVERLSYGPFYDAIGGIRKGKLNRSEIEYLITTAIFEHRRLQFELRSGGQAFEQVKRLLQLLESLNDMKNRGLYVSRERYSVLQPNDMTRDQLSEVMAFAEEAIALSEAVLKQTISPRRLRLYRDLIRSHSKMVKMSTRGTATPQLPSASVTYKGPKQFQPKGNVI